MMHSSTVPRDCVNIHLRWILICACMFSNLHITQVFFTEYLAIWYPRPRLSTGMPYLVIS